MEKLSGFDIGLFTIIIFFFFNGCKSPEKLIKTFHLQEVEARGPVNTSPIHITDSTDTPSFTFSPRFSYNTQKNLKGFVEGHTLVNSQGFFQIDTFFNDDGTVIYRETPGKNNIKYEGRNLTWNTSTLTVGLDIDMKLSQHFALFTGMNYSTQKNTNVWGGIAGLGFFSSKNNIGFRIDGGVHIQEIYYDAYTLVSVTGSENYILFYHDKNKTTHLDLFVNFTFNTAYKDWAANFFINGGFTGQTLVDFEPKDLDPDFYLPVPPYLLPVNINRNVIVNDMRGESVASFVHFTTGVYFNVTDESRILIGSRFYFETQIENADKNMFIIPFAQVDFTF